MTEEFEIIEVKNITLLILSRMVIASTVKIFLSWINFTNLCVRDSTLNPELEFFTN